MSGTLRVGQFSSFSSSMYIINVAGQNCALQVFTNDEAVNLQQINSLKTLRNSNIVGYIDAVHDGRNAVLMEHYEGSTLKVHLEAQRDPLDEELICRWFSQMRDGLLYLHSSGTSHRDLQPSNVLVHNGQLKLSHFGLWNSVHQLISNVFKYHADNNNRLYLAPELLDHNPQFHPKCDVWSLGCIMYELCTLNGAFTSVTALIQREPVDISPQYTESLKDAIKKMLRKCENERSTNEDLVNYKFIGEQPQQIGDYSVQGKFTTAAANQLRFLVTRDGGTFSLKQVPYNKTASEMVEDLTSVSHHPCIVKLEKSFRLDKHMCLVFEHCEKSFTELFAQQQITDRQEILPYVIQVCAGLSHLHEFGIIHGNVKPNNIFLCADMSRVKISDFDVNRKLHAENSWKSLTIEWAHPDSCYKAPETWPLLDKDSCYYRSSVDTWSVGCFAFQCWNSTPLFDDVKWQDRVTLTRELTKKRDHYSTSQRAIVLPDECHVGFQSVIRDMLVIDPDERMSCHEMLPRLQNECGMTVNLPHLSLLPDVKEPVIPATPEHLPMSVDGNVSHPLAAQGPRAADSNGYYDLLPSSETDFQAWEKIANMKPGYLYFPKIECVGRGMQVVLVRRERVQKNNQVAYGNASDANCRDLVAKDLRLWIRFLDDQEDVNLRMEAELSLPSRPVSKPEHYNIIVKKIRQMRVGKAFTNFLIHFQPTRMMLVDSKMPRVRVKISILPGK